MIRRPRRGYYGLRALNTAAPDCEKIREEGWEGGCLVSWMMVESGTHIASTRFKANHSPPQHEENNKTINPVGKGEEEHTPQITPDAFAREGACLSSELSMR